MSLAEFYDTVVRDKKRAIEEYQTIIKTHGNQHLPVCDYQAPFTIEIFSRIRIAICYQYLQQYQKAIEYYAYGYPWHPFYLEIAECYRKIGDENNAKVMYLKTIEFHLSGKWSSDPTYAFRASLELGDKNNALKYVLCIVNRSTKPVAQYELSKILHCLEKSDPEFMDLVLKEIKQHFRDFKRLETP